MALCLWRLFCFPLLLEDLNDGLSRRGLMMHLCRELKYHVVIKFALITNFVDYRNFNERYLHLRKLFNIPPNTTSGILLSDLSYTLNWLGAKSSKFQLNNQTLLKWFTTIVWWWYKTNSERIFWEDYYSKMKWEKFCYTLLVVGQVIICI